MLYKVPLTVCVLPYEISFAEEMRLIKVCRPEYDMVGLGSWLHERDALRGFLIETRIERAWLGPTSGRNEDYYYYVHALTDAEGLTLLLCARSDWWRPEELFDDPNWSREVSDATQL